LPALEAVGWKGRPVLIVFDSDAADNEMIVDAERRLAAQLTNLGAKVGVVRIPPGEVQDDGTHAKVGIDDYIVKHGAAAFQKLLDGAEEPTAPDPATMKIKACELDPATEAKAILGQDKADNVIRLRFWRGTFWYWKNGGYREMASAEARGGVVRSLNAVSHHLGARVVGDVLEQLRALSMLSYDVEPPAWLGKPPRDWEPIDVLATKTGLVHLPTLVSGGEYLHKPTPRYFSPAALSYGFDIKATAPVAWLAFLESLWPDDPESIATLQEWFGYCLTPDTSHQKILMLIGPKRSGKGTIARVLGGLIGTGNVCGPTLASLATNFGLWPLLGKTAAIVSDARLGGRTDAYVVVERLLSISGEDSLTIDRKNLEPVTVKLLTRLMLLSNELPRLIDQSGALASRMILLGLNQSFYGREDRGLTARLLTELPGILLWSVEGWRRLRDRGYFEQPSSGNELLGELNDLTSPVGEFVAECCEVGPALSVSRRDLFDAYANWAKEHGRSHIEDHAGFGRALRAAVSAVRTARLRADGGRQRTYVGIGLRLNTTAWG